MLSRNVWRTRRRLLGKLPIASLGDASPRHVKTESQQQAKHSSESDQKVAIFNGKPNNGKVDRNEKGETIDCPSATNPHSGARVIGSGCQVGKRSDRAARLIVYISRGEVLAT
ncbi:hypothetical protein [Streptomyces sp. MS2.AVA.5]|uniref:Uncharacterized protein n=1 Tax=Streptomyces achmelvichensis TaxID=3134111 RepID=A0ACC6PY90_9ACTN